MTDERSGPEGDIEDDIEAVRRERDAALRDLEAMTRMSARQRVRFEEQLEEARLVVAERDKAQRELKRLKRQPVVRVARRIARIGRAIAGAGRLGRTGVAGVDRGRGRARVAADGSRSPAEERRLADAILASLPPVPHVASHRITVIVEASPEGAADGKAVSTRLRLPAWPGLDVSAVAAPADAKGDDGVDADRRGTAAYRAIVDASDAPLVLFVREDIEPLEDGWLARLVDALETTGASAAGPRLLGMRDDIAGEAGRRPTPAVADAAVGVFGMGADLVDGLPVAVPLGPSEGHSADRPLATRGVPALPGACLLIRREAVSAIGGIGPADLAESVELFARLARAGHGPVVVGSSVVWDRSTPGRGPGPWRASPASFRRVFSEALEGGGPWIDRSLRIGIVAEAVDTRPRPASTIDLARDPALAAELRDRFTAFDLQASIVAARKATTDTDSPHDVLVFVSPGAERRRVPRSVVTVALVQDRAEDWLDDPGFDDHDIVFATTRELRQALEQRTSVEILTLQDPSSSAVAAAVRDALARWVRAPKLALLIGPLTWEAAATWGDTAFGYAVRRQLERRVWRATVHVFAERDSPPARRADVALHIFGARAPEVHAGQLSFLWVISHSDRISSRMAARYEVVYSASDLFARQLAERVDTAVVPLHQATDPDRFFPDPTGPRHELLFVGSSRKVRRRILADLESTRHDLAVYGGGWTPDLLDPRYLRGEWIPNWELRRYYSSAAIVLCDHYDDMRDEGFISNRAYDALASGAFVVSDRVPGMEDEFDRGVVTYGDAAELAAVVEHYLGHPEDRAERVARGRAAVLGRHTFGHRVDVIVADAAGRLRDLATDAATTDP